MGESHLGLNGRTVSAVTDFTKQDPRILWLIVCKEGSPLVELLDQGIYLSVYINLCTSMSINKAKSWYASVVARLVH